MPQDFMRNEIEEIPDLLLRTKSSFLSYVEKIKSLDFSEIWIFGSGDSHCASLYGSSLLNQLDIPARAFTSMELSKFHLFSKNIKACLIAISVSGKTPRVLEGIKKFKHHYPKQTIIGLTDNPHSPLYEHVDIKILIGASPSETLVYNEDHKSIVREYDGYQNPIPQTKTYFMNIIWLTYLSFSFKKDLKTFDILYDELSINFKDWIKKSENWVNSHSITYPNKTIFVASSIFRSLAQFGAYKWFEFTYPGLDQDIEEYAHTHYFTTESETSIIFFSPISTHFTRIKEIFDGALVNLIKPEIFLLSGNIFKSNDYRNYDNLQILQVPYTSKSEHEIILEVYNYFYLMVPIFWFMYHTARKHGFDTNRFRGGKDVEKYIMGSLSTIRKSKIN